MPVAEEQRYIKPFGISGMPVPIVTEVKLQLPNGNVLTEVILSAISKLPVKEQLPKAADPIVVTLDGIVKVPVKLVQPLKQLA